MRVLDRAVWAPRAALHFERVVDILAPFAGGVDAAAASSYDRSHPILNFLFDYYHFDRRALLRWTPGAGITLDGVSKLRDQKMLWLGNGCAFSRDGHAVYDAAHASASDASGYRAINSLLQQLHAERVRAGARPRWQEQEDEDDDDDDDDL